MSLIGRSHLLSSLTHLFYSNCAVSPNEANAYAALLFVILNFVWDFLIADDFSMLFDIRDGSNPNCCSLEGMMSVSTSPMAVEIFDWNLIRGLLTIHSSRTLNSKICWDMAKHCNAALCLWASDAKKTQNVVCKCLWIQQVNLIELVSSVHNNWNDIHSPFKVSQFEWLNLNR